MPEDTVTVDGRTYREGLTPLTSYAARTLLSRVAPTAILPSEWTATTATPKGEPQMSNATSNTSEKITALTDQLVEALKDAAETNAQMTRRDRVSRLRIEALTDQLAVARRSADKANAELSRFRRGARLRIKTLEANLEEMDRHGLRPNWAGMIDRFVAERTAFADFEALLADDDMDYRPTLRGDRVAPLADIYDAVQAMRGDPRRAYRGD
jgi:hypothetical protein